MTKNGRVGGEQDAGTVDERSCVPAAVSTAAVGLIPEEANQMPAPLDLRPIAVTCFLCNLWARTRFVDVTRWCNSWLPKSGAGGIPEHRIQEYVVWSAVGNGR